ncbi:MAG: DHH family phosphoesterase, partial [Candidatus Omnitrophota bacterium]
AKSRSIIIASHINPDADSLCSSLALARGLKSLDKKVSVAVAGRIPALYRDLPGINLVACALPYNQDLAISIDCASTVQLGKLAAAFFSCRQILEIDHHLYRYRFGTFQLVDETISSAAELVYLLLQKLHISVDKVTAENLLTAIVTETSAFRLPQVDSHTFGVCARLMRSGLNYQKITQRYYWQQSVPRLRLSGLCFSRIKEEAGGRLIWSQVLRKDFRRLKGKQEDVDAVADELRAIKKVKIAILFREEPGNKLRVSLRAKGTIDVGVLASQYGGGGHFDVASCIIPRNPYSIRHFINKAAKLLSG